MSTRLLKALQSIRSWKWARSFRTFAAMSTGFASRLDINGPRNRRGQFVVQVPTGQTDPVRISVTFRNERPVVFTMDRDRWNDLISSAHAASK